MWKCKHCEKMFDYVKVSDKANHSRWCDSNPKRNIWNMGQSTINKYGNYKKFTVTCYECDKNFIVNERENLFPTKQKYFCSRSCSNTIGGKAKRDKYGITQYSTIAEKYYHRKCVACDVTDILDVHHIDGNRNNNHPRNLIFLCPNDHYRLHRNNDQQVLRIIEGHGTAWGGHFTCNEDISGVQIPNAPPEYFKEVIS